MIETERLRIGPLAGEAVEQLFALWRDPANERVPSTVDDAQVRAWLASAPWGVWERDTDELVGDCGLFRNDEGEWELAYGFRRDRWGRGYASEAAAACVRYGFETLGLTRIVADIEHHGHPASPRVLAKLGFVPLRDAGDKVVYVLEA